MPTYVPIMLDCENRICVVIGGGQVAERKIKELLTGAANVTVISPSITVALRQYRDQGKLNWLPRKYAEGDLEGAFMVHAAADDPEVNRRVAEEAKARGIIANVTDQPALGSFIHPSVLRRGRLLIAVSTSGAGPLAARAIRRKLEDDFGTEYEEYLDSLYDMRKMIQEQVSDTAARQKLLRKACGPDMLESLRQGTFRLRSPEEIRQWINDNQEE
ncbi:bifunctional precorrin-2 dehydrogenase/sirohydrochlorin ferrochelatase [Paenibacillus dokdonensis]|uniref:precorrin-2 dehydrogenase n=1 Tax=Paenibacillus dokdonensis TaxID=2567944 RepID=A0ABU6GPD8_9BACL|nr:bifunctional precorrin-2 dehydrogenase/sirohydrochlorin ferrochelatase [Paenibacillus dokdonensis]MEC0241599.1 bifunctional precorrin-2 dehydrogenase/sirohydrochlorin ferrochelatase [Paenibacillus dokdonensis]